MYVAILGRQPELGAAELERLYGAVSWASSEAVTIDTPNVDLSIIGGSQKIGRITARLPLGTWKTVSQKIVHAYTSAWNGHTNKITLGISVYGFDAPARDIQKTGLVLKNRLKGAASLRLIPSQDAALSSATSHHNKLGLSDNKVELLVVRGTHDVIVAESIGTQNITAYAKRDQERPKRDAFVGMLPPKLAQMMINLAATPSSGTLLDPFCGTGVVLQEAALRGLNVYGSDLSDKMIDYTKINLEWLARTKHLTIQPKLEQGDAMKHRWTSPIDVVVGETYLGQPFSAPPSPSKLREVRGNCNHIISTFLDNISAQLAPGTQLCLAVPAWRRSDGSFVHLPLVDTIERHGFERIRLQTSDRPLLYYREDQVVARELLLLRKIAPRSS